MQNTTKSTGKNQKKGSLKGIGAPRALQIIVSELAQIFSWVKSTILKEEPSVEIKTENSVLLDPLSFQRK